MTDLYGLHAFSADGASWTVATDTKGMPALPWPKNVSWSNGSTTYISRMERPQVVLEPHTNRVLYLATAVCVGGESVGGRACTSPDGVSHKSWGLYRPVAQKSDDDTAPVCTPQQSGEFAFGGCLPPWPATYNMSRSTVLMPCNYSGFSDASGLLSRYGLVDFDWSNAMSLWTADRPMDAAARMLTQARAMKEANPDSHVWVYRCAPFC